jgi:UrcA family protein
MNTKLVVALAAAAALLPALALAADPVQTTQIIGSKSGAPSVVVHVGDLNLATQAGERTLHERLSTAAWQVCKGMMPNPVSIAGCKCRTELVESAQADVHNATLR